LRKRVCGVVCNVLHVFRQVLAKICFRKLTYAVFAGTIKQVISSFESYIKKYHVQMAFGSPDAPYL
jgi:hypothetical protein